MRTHAYATLLLAFTVIASSPAAQSTNLFGISPGSVDAVSRSGVPGPSQGDVLIEVRGVSWELASNTNGNTGADFISVGDTGNTPPANGTGDGRINGFQVVLQDQNASTTGTFDFRVVAESTGAAIGNPASPAIAGGGILFQTAPMTTPPGVGVVAVTLSATLATPADVLPSGLTELSPGGNNSSWYYGVGLPANPLWTADGLAVHMSSFDGLGLPFPNAGDNPRDNVVSVEQARDVTNGVVVAKSSTARTQEIWIFTEAPVLNHGAAISAPAQVGPDPNFGVAGNYPDPCGTGNAARVAAFAAAGYAGRAGVGDGIAVRLRAAREVGFPVLLFISNGQPGAPGAVSGFSGVQTYLRVFDGAFVLPTSSMAMPIGTVPASGELTTTLIGPSASQPLCSLAGTRMASQAVIMLSDSALRMSNGASTLF